MNVGQQGAGRFHPVSKFSKLEAIRCHKRYIARKVFGLIRQHAKEIAQPQIASL